MRAADSRFGTGHSYGWRAAGVSLLVQLQAVDEHSLQLGDVVRGLDGDAESARGGRQASGRVVGVSVTSLSAVPVGGGALQALAHVQAVLRRQAGAVVGLVVEVQPVLGPRAVAGAVGRAVGHHARLQAAVPPHGPVQVQTGDQRLLDVHALGPVDGTVVDGDEGSLEADGEDQVLLS